MRLFRRRREAPPAPVYEEPAEPTWADWCADLVRGGATELRMDRATYAELLEECRAAGWQFVKGRGPGFMGVPVVFDED